VQEIDGRTYFWMFFDEDKCHNKQPHNEGMLALPNNKRGKPNMGLYFWGTELPIKQLAQHYRPGWMCKVEVPEDAVVIKDPDGMYRTNKLYLHPIVRHVPEGINMLMGDSAFFEQLEEEKDEDHGGDRLILSMIEKGASTDTVDKLRKRFEHTDRIARIAAYIYCGDVAALANHLKYRPEDICEGPMNYEGVCHKVNGLPKPLQRRIVRILVARKDFRGLAGLYHQAPDNMVPYLTEQLLKEIPKQGSMNTWYSDLIHHFTLWRFQDNVRDFSADILEAINTASNGLLEEVLLTVSLYPWTKDEEREFVLKTYQMIPNKKKEADMVLVDLLVRANQGFATNKISIEYLKTIVDTVGIKSTVKISQRERLPKAVIHFWNTQVASTPKKHPASSEEAVSCKQ